MAKSDCKLEEVEIESAYSQQTTPKWAEGKQVNAFDTETYDGSVFMLSYALGEEFSGYVDNGDVSELSGKQIFDKITHRECRSSINVWYNLDFDANAILSGLLNESELAQLAITNNVQTVINGMSYNISYVKGKFLSITDKHRNRYDHFDISQFFYTSLDNAAEEWLGENKIEEIDTSKFGSITYIQNNYELIQEYAEKDALLTQRLGKELIKEAEKLQIPMGRPFSTGYMSAEFQRSEMDEKPGFGKRPYQSLFWKSYYGGRFEVFERGDVGNIVAPDINSAYPAVMRNLPDPTTLDWHHHANDYKGNEITYDPDMFDFEDICNADYGVVNVTVSTNPNRKIQPFAYKMDGKVKYPVMENTTITVLKEIFEFAVNNGLVKDYTLNEAWFGYEIDETEYPFTWIDDLYADRKTFGKREKAKKELLVKIVLNSAYGKTCQTTEKKKIVNVTEDEMYECNENEKVYPSIFLSTTQREHLSGNEVVISSQKCGRRFNPFFASYITGMTRLKLHETVLKYGLEENTYMFATDCIMVDKRAYENSDFCEVIKTPNNELEEDEFRESAIESLGWWDFDYEGTAFIVGSGVYEVEFGECQEDCEDECNNPEHQRKTKTRGFTEKSLDKSLKQLAKENPEAIPIENERPLTIPEVLISPDSGSVSEFVKHTKELNPNFDTKRNWAAIEPDFHDLLNMHETSKPLHIREELVDRYDDYEPTYKEAEKQIAHILND